MKIKNEKEALQMFCEEENDYRDKFKKPFVNEKDGGRIWATNGHILLMDDPKLTRCKYTEFSQNRLLFPLLKAVLPLSKDLWGSPSSYR